MDKGQKIKKRMEELTKIKERGVFLFSKSKGEKKEKKDKGMA